MSFTLEQADESTLEEFPLIPEGLYDAVIVEVVERETPFTDDDGNTKTQLSWKLKITDEEYPNRIVFGNTGTKFVNHPNCKFYSWSCEAFGVDNLPVGFDLELEDLEDVPVQVKIEHYTKKKDNSTREKAIDLIRIGVDDAGNVFG